PAAGDAEAAVPEDAAPTDEPPGPDGARARAGGAAEAAEAAERRRDETQQVRDLAERALATTREAVLRAKERAELLGRLAELDEQVPRVEELAAELAAATRAGAVSRAIAETQRRAAQAAGAETAQAEARAAVAAAALPGAGDPPRVTADAPADELAALAADAPAESGRLEPLALVLVAAHDDAAQADLADREALEHAQAAAVREAEITTTLPALRHAAQEQADAARRAGRLAPALTERSDQLADLADAVRERGRALAESAEAAASATRAKARAVQLRQQRFDAITAELAAALADDTPCPVCGALDHPDPAEVRADHVSKDAERDADAEATRREAAAGKARDRVAGLTGQVRTLLAALLRSPAALVDGPHPGAGESDGAVAGADSSGEDAAVTVAGMLADLRGTLLDEAVLLAADDDLGAAGPDRTATEIDAVARTFAAAAAQAASSAADLAGAEAGLAALVESQTGAHADLATHRADERAAGLRAAAARDRAARALATVPSALRDPALLAHRVDAVARFARACTHAQQAVRVAAQAGDELRRAEADATDAATEAGFTDPGAALAAVREPDWLADAQTRIQAHRDERVQAQSRLAAPELAAAAADPSGRLDEHEHAAAAAKAAHEEAWATAATTAQRARRLEALVDEYTGAYAALAPRRAAAAQLRQLADLAIGRAPANQHGMPLSSYVLAARLEEVAHAASRRLAAMSGGRYTLVHDTGERRDRRRKAGLGLLVLDAWTGRSRPTATLSGGETFQAALSLALGLADVVSAESGGHAIDALFVDEGFGTLDPDSLDEVMNVLDELRAGGRLVGVVSHVADLRLRIPTQIQVRKGPSGSTVETTA
ncbi:SbcC/MukB-like Walker B domain-containing protein, partial [Frankia sp. AgW1.1]|uniref:SbcC/MukB-like Walker B domain-containing protein n=1 Tax=Frankia sp. AgW1.1 TaxID=1836971 RepID=UPI00193414DF